MKKIPDASRLDTKQTKRIGNTDVVIGMSCLEHCSAACCRRGVTISLTTDETNYLVGLGAKFKEISEDEKKDIATKYRLGKFSLIRTILGRENTLTPHEFVEDCPNLDQETNKCLDVGQPERPAICNSMQPGGFSCLSIASRSEYSTVTPVQFTDFLSKTSQVSDI